MSSSPLLSLTFLSCSLLLLLLRTSLGDVFTAMVDLENLLASEAATTTDLIEQYIRSEQARLQRLSEWVKAPGESVENGEK